jgi:uncharacterized protein (TIGR03790 family)
MHRLRAAHVFSVLFALASLASIHAAAAQPALSLSAPNPSVHSPKEVVVVYNADSPVSTAIARDYTSKRNVTNLVAIHCIDSAVSTKNETISLADYNSRVAAPISSFLAGHKGINFIVLTKGVPIRIDGGVTGSRDEGTTGNLQASVDSYLAAIDYPSIAGAVKIKITGSGATGYVWLNRYWKATAPFTHAAFGGYLVTRLDGYTQADATALVTRALAARANGDPRADGNEKVLLDVQPGFGIGDKTVQPLTVTGDIPDESDYGSWNADMVRAADLLRSAAIPVELDLSPTFVGNRSNLLGYFSWGSNDQKYSNDAYESLTFAPGSIGDTAVSTSARTFLPTTGGQSLIADLIAHGITGVKGYTNEPLLQAVASPSVAMDRYFISGMNLAESFYAASRFVGWEDVVIGDPLCRVPSSSTGSKKSVKAPAANKP